MSLRLPTLVATRLPIVCNASGPMIRIPAPIWATTACDTHARDDGNLSLGRLTWCGLSGHAYWQPSSATNSDGRSTGWLLQLRVFGFGHQRLGDCACHNAESSTNDSVAWVEPHTRALLLPSIFYGIEELAKPADRRSRAVIDPRQSGAQNKSALAGTLVGPLRSFFVLFRIHKNWWTL